uniref:Ammonium transporter 1 n=1 Tax=Hadrurus spadix TaxID=141984 RepID=A0A1W7RAY5_9SCOR
MQAGFPLVQYGSFRNSSTAYVLLVSFFNTLITCIIYWLVGYAFAFGGGGNKFIGIQLFAGYNTSTSSMAHWFFHFTLSATVVSIVTSSMGERASFVAYVLVTLFLSAIIHPIVVHWCWNRDGWLYINANDSEMKYVDYAGAGVLHICAGTCSMISVAVAGTRATRFDLVTKKSGHIVPLTVIGGFLLIIGLLAIAAGAKGQTGFANGYANNAVASTVLAAAFGGLVSLVGHQIQSSRDCLRRGIKPSALSSFLSFLTGCMAAMVSVSAGCERYHLWAAVIVGIVGSLLSFIIHFLVTFFKREDPLHTIAVNFGSGVWGLIAAPAFRLYGDITDSQYRIHQKEIVWNLAAGSSIIVWAGILSILIFGMLKLLGLYPIEYDIKGSDILRKGQTTMPLPPGTDPYFPTFSHGNPNDRKNMMNRDYDFPLQQKIGTNNRHPEHYGQINAMANAAYVSEIATQL